MGRVSKMLSPSLYLGVYLGEDALNCFLTEVVEPLNYCLIMAHTQLCLLTMLSKPQKSKPSNISLITVLGLFIKKHLLEVTFIAIKWF